ncbi:MAG TPA: hypothetical protein VNG33_20035 [Polyangiaceae bacterium]|nr:hypothetical protein [Polyangiaceae bacterium]
MSAANGSDPGFSMLPLLVHSSAVSASARSALLAAQSSTPEARPAALKSAARVLHAETGLECRDILDIVGLDEGSC